MGGDRNNPKGYVIQLYQYAIRYAYNNDQFISYFNGNIDDKSFKDAQNADYLVLGDFDLIEINPINYFIAYNCKRYIGAVMYKYKCVFYNLRKSKSVCLHTFLVMHKNCILMYTDSLQ